ncbi:MAG TPA: hypothetical protein VGK38_07415 [Prolixibacteraceae bacterium]|jgi:hypothetical protein
MKEKDENIENRFGNLKKGQPFRVPDDYFETFAERLMVRIGEENRQDNKRTLFFYLKPVLMVAASLVLVMLMVYVPVRKFFPVSNKPYLAQLKVNTDSVDSVEVLPATIFSYFSEAQFLSAFSDMNKMETDTLSNDDLEDFIADNYNDYDVIANN